LPTTKIVRRKALCGFKEKNSQRKVEKDLPLYNVLQKDFVDFIKEFFP